MDTTLLRRVALPPQRVEKNDEIRDIQGEMDPLDGQRDGFELDIPSLQTDHSTQTSHAKTEQFSQDAFIKRMGIELGFSKIPYARLSHIEFANAKILQPQTSQAPPIDSAPWTCISTQITSLRTHMEKLAFVSDL